MVSQKDGCVYRRKVPHAVISTVGRAFVVTRKTGQSQSAGIYLLAAERCGFEQSHCSHTGQSATSAIGS